MTAAAKVSVVKANAKESNLLLTPRFPTVLLP